MNQGAIISYSVAFNLASAGGDLVTNATNAGRAGRYFPPVASPYRRLNSVSVKFSSGATQTIAVYLQSAGAVDRLIASGATSGATDWGYVPEGDVAAGPGEQFRVTVTNTGTPAITGTIHVTLEEA